MRGWHHAPLHCLTEHGAYMVTSGTYLKQHFFTSPERLDILHDRLMDLAEDYGWSLQAWAVFSNHYHFVALAPDGPRSLSQMMEQLHWQTAVAINDLDGTPGRKIWHNYYDKYLSFEKSYLVRLRYVHYNPVKHGVCRVPESYPWCSAAWFEQTATPSFARTVKSFPCDRLQVPDDYEPHPPV